MKTITINTDSELTALGLALANELARASTNLERAKAAPSKTTWTVDGAAKHVEALTRMLDRFRRDTQPMPRL